MKETITEIESMVRDMNRQFAIQTEGSGSWSPFIMILDGEHIAISFFHNSIWDSEYDERQYRVGMEEMPLRDYLIQEINLMLKAFSGVALK